MDEIVITENDEDAEANRQHGFLVMVDHALQQHPRGIGTMGFVTTFGVAAIVGILCQGMTWWFRVGRRRITICLLLFPTLAVASSLATALVLAIGSYIVGGYLNEPVRFVAIFFVITLPVSLAVGVPFLVLGPRRYPRGHCQKCGYDLTGNPSGTCPECGSSVPEPAAGTHDA